MSTAGTIEYKIGGNASELVAAFEKARVQARGLMRDVRGSGGAPGPVVGASSIAGGLLPNKGRFTAEESAARLARFRAGYAGPGGPGGPPVIPPGAVQSEAAFAAGMWEVGKSLGVVAAAGAAARFALHEMVSGFQTASSLHNTAESLGVSAENMQRLHYAFAQGGASAEQFDAGFAKLSTTLGKAKEGDSGAIGAFRRMGISIREIDSMDADAMLLRVADSIQRAVDPSRQLALAQGVLGKNIRSLLPSMKDGAEGIREMMGAATVATDEQIAALERAGQQWENFWRKREAAKVAAQGQAIGETEDAIKKYQLTPLTGSGFLRTGAIVGGTIQGLMNKYLGTSFGVQDAAGSLDKIAPERLAAGEATTGGNAFGKPPEIAADAMQRIGLYVGSGGPAGESHARDTAANTRKMAQDISELVNFVVNGVQPPNMVFG